ncbi:hypothetical protein [Haliscomenobacter hydrossis]|uniref:Glutamine cyclotransferase n=1 Tax=Haliscomenobacter hydrossis (strain ATCC 27775 / DSM 1100 / LMG 10767 / O) TaxID=760192 RepID=F4KZ30_HALH1|nr:hypothetical protein [Haliscomenobacter hydrossis]AEE53684.1 hypothetical protein Halhy_5861 [Haliscomenobacter hydrossis DSM 1100]
MKLTFYPILMLACLFFCAGCTAYETQYEGPYTDGDNVNTSVNYEILFVENGVLKFATPNLTKVKTLPAGANITKASINYRHDRIAFKTAAGNIIVTDTALSTQTILPNTSGVLWFDWHANNQTLYMLNANSTLSFHGPAITVATTNLRTGLPGYFTNDLGIKTVAITPAGTVVFGVGLDQSIGPESGVWVRKTDGKSTRLRTDYDAPTHIRLNADGNLGTVILKTGSSEWGFLSLTPNDEFLTRESRSTLIAPSSSIEEEVVGWDILLQELYLRKNQRKLKLSGFVSDLDW